MPVNCKGWRIRVQDGNVNAVIRHRLGREGLQQSKHLGGCHSCQMQSWWWGLSQILVCTSLAATGNQPGVVLQLHLLNIATVITH